MSSDAAAVTLSKLKHWMLCVPPMQRLHASSHTCRRCCFRRCGWAFKQGRLAEGALGGLL
jgi:hypothetical protein